MCWSGGCIDSKKFGFSGVQSSRWPLSLMAFCLEGQGKRFKVATDRVSDQTGELNGCRSFPAPANGNERELIWHLAEPSEQDRREDMLSPFL